MSSNYTEKYYFEQPALVLDIELPVFHESCAVTIQPQIGGGKYFYFIISSDLSQIF